MKAGVTRAFRSPDPKSSTRDAGHRVSSRYPLCFRHPGTPPGVPGRGSGLGPSGYFTDHSVTPVPDTTASVLPSGLIATLRTSSPAFSTPFDDLPSTSHSRAVWSW